jgi:hypothetical protein
MHMLLLAESTAITHGVGGPAQTEGLETEGLEQEHMPAGCLNLGGEEEEGEVGSIWQQNCAPL